jgi:hypothetical protein
MALPRPDAACQLPQTSANNAGPVGRFVQSNLTTFGISLPRRAVDAHSQRTGHAGAIEGQPPTAAATWIR